MESQNDISEGLAVLKVVQSILEEGRNIFLPPRDIALLLLIWNYVKTQKNLVFTVTEHEIRHLATRLDGLDLKDTQGAERRYTESLTRLLKCECLSRADINRLAQSEDTEYQLTALGEGVASWHFEHERFSGEPLTAILRAFNTHLTSIALIAEKVESPEDWHKDVIMQMQVVLNNMLVDVRRHQQELDRQHDHLRQFIPSLLTESSEESIKFCENKLAQVITTINDLMEVTLAAANTASQQLEKIEKIGLSQGYPKTEQVCGELDRRLSSVMHWTSQRANDWVEHHNVVHEFLRGIVNIDRRRRLTEALKRAVASEPLWTIKLTDEFYMIKFREVEHKETERHLLPRRPKKGYSPQSEEISVDNVPTILETILVEEIQDGELILSRMLRKACAQGITEGRVISKIPWLIGKMIERGAVDKKTRPLEVITDILEVEELKVSET